MQVCVVVGVVFAAAIAEAQTLTCASDVTVEATSKTATTATFANATLAPPDPAAIINATAYSGAGFALGATVVTFRAYSPPSYAESAQCSLTVTVTDTTAPVPDACPANLEVLVAAAATAGTASWTEPTFSDSVYASHELTLAQTHTVGQSFPLGATTVVYNATDGAANTALCSFTVQVTAQSAGSSSSSAAAVAGGVAGGIVAVGLIAVAAVLVVRRRRAAADGHSDEEGKVGGSPRHSRDNGAGGLLGRLRKMRRSSAAAGSMAQLVSSIDFRRILVSLGFPSTREVKVPRELRHQCIGLQQQLGAGAYGDVFRGAFMDDGNVVYIAAKLLREDARESERRALLFEPAVLAQCVHPNIVQLVGVVTRTMPNMVILEYAENGSLKSFLQRLRAPLKQELKLRMTGDVAEGLAFLAQHNIVHRDLAVSGGTGIGWPGVKGREGGGGGGRRKGGRGWRRG